MEEPHAVLGLAPGASREEVDRAYRKLVRRYPPELNPDRFARVRGAYELLTSLEHRMAEVRKDPEAALESLFPPPPIQLKPEPPPPEPLEPEDLEPLLAPLRLELLMRILDTK
jgi:curved DNA-binding protein CbpA